MDARPRHFVYLSESKITALFDQVPRMDLQSIARSFTIDLKFLKADIGMPNKRPDTVYSKLKIVVEYLSRRSMIGSVDHPADYFAESSLFMTWGPYGQAHFGPAIKDSPLVWFAANTQESILGLGGSSSNLVGFPGDAPTHSHSATPILLNAIYEELEIPPPYSRSPSHRVDDWNLRAIELAASQSQGTGQHLEFVAKRLLWGGSYRQPTKHVLLGTPLYVALAV